MDPTAKSPLAATIVTGEDGRYRFDSLAAGFYAILVTDVAARRQGGAGRDDPLDLLSGPIASFFTGIVRRSLRDYSGPRVRVEAGRSVRHDMRLGRLVPLAGLVTVGERKAPGASVSLIPIGHSDLVLPVATDKNGAFRFSHVAIGRYRVQCRFRGFSIRCGVVDVSGEKPKSVVVRLGEGKARIRLADDNSEPIRRISRIRLDSLERPWVGVSCADVASEDGEYVMAFLDGRPSDMLVKVRVDGVETTKRVKLGAGETSIDLTLRFGSQLSVHTHDTDGARVRGVAIRVAHESGKPEFVSQTREDGTLEFRLQPGCWLVGPLDLASLPWKWAAEPTIVRLRAGEEKIVEVVVDR